MIYEHFDFLKSFHLIYILRVNVLTMHKFLFRKTLYFMFNKINIEKFIYPLKDDFICKNIELLKNKTSLFYRYLNSLEDRFFF